MLQLKDASIFQRENLILSDINLDIQKGEFNYIIHHSTGSDQVALDAQNAADGWNFLGTYYFSKGEATIDLSDKSNGQLVVADAIKWVKN